MIIENPVRLIRELKGAPLSIIFALHVVGQRVTQEWLERSTGYTDKPVSQALSYLQEIGLVDKTRTGWQLTGQARQLPIPLALDGPEPVEEPPTGDEIIEIEEPSRNISDSGSLESLVSKNLDILDLTTDSLDSEVGKIPTPDGEMDNVARILGAASSLFGKRILGKPEEYRDTRLLLAWIAHAWDTKGQGKGQTNSPGGLVYWAFHKNKDSMPDPKYLEDPDAYLPESFLVDAGLLEVFDVENPEEPEIEPDIEIDLDVDPSVDLDVNGSTSALLAWQALCRQLEMDSRDSYQRYIEPCRLSAYDPAGGVFHIRAPTAYIRDFLESRYKSQLTRLMTGICNRSVNIRFVN